MERTDAGVCVPGFKAQGKKEGKYGVGMIYCWKGADCAMMITSNKVRAAPLLVSKEHSKNRIKAVIANSGNANAYTGEQGATDAREMCSIAGKLMGVIHDQVLVASTGVIGRRMDMEKIKKLAGEVSGNLGDAPQDSKNFSRAIMTTDTFEKSLSVRTELKDGTRVEIGGTTKGAGMIAPQLSHATMLTFITTDASIPKDKINSVMEEAVRQSFDMVIVDGDMSTNDSVMLLASGEAGNEDIDDNFQEALNYVCRELAKLIARDGEGATKYIEVRVENALSPEDARLAARAVVGSSLVKSAIFGRDPNWGRIIAAVGYSGAESEPERYTLYIGDGKKKVTLVENGKPIAFAGTRELKEAEGILESQDIYISIDLGQGEHSATAFGCDLTYDYVKINAEYTT